MRAFIFPGQGSQAVGMGGALANASRAAKDVFDEVDEALGQNLFRLMREGPEEELKLTENAQPAIMANAIAVFRTMGVRLEDVANFVAGPLNTLPIYVFSSIRRGVTPEINAIATIVIGLSFFLVLLSQRLNREAAA